MNAIVKKTRALFVFGLLVPPGCTTVEAPGNTPTLETTTINRYIDAENASISGTTLQDNGQSYSIVRESNGVQPDINSVWSYSGQKSLHFKILADTDGAKERSEIRVRDPIDFDLGMRWYGFAMRVTPDFYNDATADDNYNIFTQLWQYSPASPPVALSFKPNTSNAYWLSVRSDDDGTVNLSTKDSRVYEGTFVLGGHSNTFVLGVRPDTNGSNGRVELWQAGQLKYVYTGKLGFSSGRQAFKWKVGLYRDNEIRNTQEIWFDEIRYGTDHLEVDPRTYR